MIKLHRKKDDPKSDMLEEKLINMVLAYETVDHSGDNHEKTPYIEESGQIIEGNEQVDEWLTTLESELDWQRSISGDACYFDPKTGKIC
ncbi:MAG: hypothetical protein WD267_00595 [Balneolales bacterium]